MKVILGTAIAVILLAALVGQARDDCVKAARGPLVAAEEANPAGGAPAARPTMPVVRVGHPAPDFEASALVGGSFKNVKLSDHKGKWVVLCFYPGDFTFV